MGTSQGAVVSVIKKGVGVPAVICGVSDRDSAALREMLMTRLPTQMVESVRRAARDNSSELSPRYDDKRGSIVRTSSPCALP
jgi:hypothetical protein